MRNNDYSELAPERFATNVRTDDLTILHVVGMGLGGPAVLEHKQS